MSVAPFRFWCQKVLPAVYDDSLSYYELLCKLVAKVNEVIANLGTADDAINELMKWFNNLDVSEEVNAKLDEMAASGELQNIIGQYLQLNTSLVFNNVAAMLASTALVNGSTARTLGYYEVNDGGDGLYQIRTVTTADSVNGYNVFDMGRDNLIAILVADAPTIKQFGAKAVAGYDNAPHIRAAIAYGKDVIVPFGAFDVFSVITVPAGSTSRKFVAEEMGVSGATIRLSADAYFNILADSVFFNGLYFIGYENATKNGSKGIVARGADGLNTDLWVENCVFKRIEYPIHVDGRGCQVHNTLFVECGDCVHYNYVSTTEGELPTTDRIVGGRGFAVTNCRFHSIIVNTAATYGAITIQQGSVVFNPLITGNQLDNGQDSFIDCAGDMYGGVIANNILNSLGTNAMWFRGVVDGTVIEGNTVLNYQERYGLGVPATLIRFEQPVVACKINGNYFYGCSNWAIVFVNGATATDVSGNTFAHCGTADNATYSLVFWNAGDFVKCVISGNVVVDRQTAQTFFARSSTLVASGCIVLGNSLPDGMTAVRVNNFPVDTNTVQTY